VKRHAGKRQSIIHASPTTFYLFEKYPVTKALHVQPTALMFLKEDYAAWLF